MKKILLFASSIFLAGCGGEKWENEFKNNCLSLIKDSLVSPASMKLVDYQSFEFLGGYHDCVSMEDRLEKIECSSKSHEHPVSKDGKVIRSFVAFVEFDSSNSLGVPIRNNLECYYPHDKDADPETFYPELFSIYER